MSRLLAIFLWLFAVSTAAHFVWTRWPLPTAITTHAAAIDQQFKLTMIIIGVGFVVVHALLGLAVWRFGQRKEVAVYSLGNMKAELAWTALTLVVFIFLAITGQRVWADLRVNEPQAGAVEVEITGQQFVWNFRYPGTDGRFGRTEPRLYNDANNSIGARPGPLGIDTRDPLGRDDVVATGLMVIPAGRPVNVTLRAKDVTHDFYVPALRLKQDAVPGMKIRMRFTATQPGRYEIACAELCGQLHHQMRAYLEVKSEAEFEQWLRERTAATNN